MVNSGRCKSIYRLFFMLLCVVSGTVSAIPYEEIHNQLPPGFQRHITIEPFLGKIYYELNSNRSKWHEENFHRVLKGGERGMQRLKRASINDLPYAVKCDGAYAFTNAYFFLKFRSTLPVKFMNRRDEVDKQSPTMIPLTEGLTALLIGNHSAAENFLTQTIFTNLYFNNRGEANRRQRQYLNNPETRDQLLAEAKAKIESMSYTREKFEQCDPSSESVRLMLAQWGAWGLVNAYKKQKKQWEMGRKLNKELEILLRIKSSRIRAGKNGPYYYDKEGNLKI